MVEYNRVELKERAKSAIKGKVFMVFLPIFVYLALSGVASALGEIHKILSFIATIAIMVVEIGLSIFMLNFIDGKKAEVSNLFIPYQKGMDIFFKHLGTLILRGLLIFLWALLLIIPGIIKALAYSQAAYIRAENPEMSAMDALKESEKLMDGRKMDYFILQLSFIGWVLLSALTFGILFIYVAPYMVTASAMFYRMLKPAQEEQAEIKSEDPVIS